MRVELDGEPVPGQRYIFNTPDFQRNGNVAPSVVFETPLEPGRQYLCVVRDPVGEIWRLPFVVAPAPIELHVILETNQMIECVLPRQTGHFLAELRQVIQDKLPEGTQIDGLGCLVDEEDPIPLTTDLDVHNLTAGSVIVAKTTKK